MPKQEHQKLKTLALADILRRETDDTHGLTLQQLIDRLAQQGIAAERKSLYDDLHALEAYGLDIVRTRGKITTYALAGRDFELPELKLLVDAVQSCRFLTVKKSRELIGKLERLGSRFEASDMQRQVYVAHRVKSMNESVLYSIDALHGAIAAGRQITFRYFSWTVDKKQALRRDGALYRVSPYALVWDDEMYYLIAYDESAAAIRHYRVDKMLQITRTEEKRTGQALFDGLDMAQYTSVTFGMFGGKAEDVELLMANRLAGVILDRFGRDVTLVPAEEGFFRVRLKAVVSPQFMGFVAGFGAEAKILSPQHVADAFADMCRDMLAQYEGKQG